MQSILRNIAPSTVLRLADSVSYAEGQVVSKTLIQNDGVGITLFAFAEGEGISTHESKGDALVLALDGNEFILSTGESIVMPNNVPHAVYGVENFKMLLVVTFPPRG